MRPQPVPDTATIQIGTVLRTKPHHPRLESSRARYSLRGARSHEASKRAPEAVLDRLLGGPSQRTRATTLVQRATTDAKCYRR